MRTPTRRLILSFAVLSMAPGCFGEQAAECLGTAIGSSLGRSLGVGLYEGSRAEDRPDDVRPVGPVWIGGAHAGGRLVAVFDGPLVSGTLPRFTDGGACQSTGDFAYLHTGGDGGVLENVTATLTVTQSARTDAGLPTLFRFTSLAVELADGGQRPLGDRDLNVVLP